MSKRTQPYRYGVPAKYLELPLDPYNKSNHAWNKGEEGHVYTMWRNDYKKMMRKINSEVHQYCYDNAPKNQGAIGILKLVECERDAVPRHVKKYDLYKLI